MSTPLVSFLSCPFMDKLPRRKNIKVMQSTVTPSALRCPQWLTGSEYHCAYHPISAPLPEADISFVAVRRLFLNICVVGGTSSVDWKICFNTAHICNTQQCWQIHLNSISNPAPILHFAGGSVCCGLLCAASGNGNCW